MSDEIKTCPDCGRNSTEFRDHMFTGRDAYVRVHEGWIQCKGCGYEGKSKEELDAK